MRQSLWVKSEDILGHRVNRYKSNTTFLKGESMAGENFPARFSQQLRGQTLQRGLKYTPIAMFVLFHSHSV